MGGGCVRLSRGRFGKVRRFSENPVAVARRFEKEGAGWIHIVDLDGARDGFPRHLSLVKRIRRTVSCGLQFGGGLRCSSAIEMAVRCGADKIILGTAAILSPQLLQNALRRWPGRIIAALDVRKNKPVAFGWQKRVRGEIGPLLRRLFRLGVRDFLVTDAERDGMFLGPNLSLYRKLGKIPEISFFASGGIGSLKDIRSLVRLPHPPKAAIIGKAIYTGRLNLGRALAVARAL